jgi:hypothetical protein
MKMRKSIFVASVIVLSVMSVSWGTIKSINVNGVDSTYTAGSGVLSLVDAADVVVENTVGVQTTYVNGSFNMTTTLAADVSAGGIASGQFVGGSLAFLDGGANVLLAGNILSLNLIEVFNNIGLLAGNGQFQVTGGSLSGDFVYPTGDIVQISFNVFNGISDFAKDFDGDSNLSMTPIVPEPVTIGLLSIGGLFLIRRKR